MDLQTYIRVYIIKQFDTKNYDLDDVCQEANLVLLESTLASYVFSNVIPRGKDLSFLKSLLSRTKLRFIQTENRQRTGRRSVSVGQYKMEKINDTNESSEDSW